MRSGDRVRVTVQVIEAGTDLHLWSQHYDGNLGDVLGLDAAVVERIAREIGAVLTPAVQRRMAAARQVQPDAQDEYLRGKYAANGFTTDANREALGHFEKAVSLDQAFPLAYVGLANVHRALGNRSDSPEREEHYQRAREAAMRALQLDDELPAAHLALANLDFYANWDWAAASGGFTRALELNPNDPDAHQQYGWYLAARGDVDGALTHAQKARELDPLAQIRRTTTAGILFYGRRYTEAIKELNDVVVHDPNFVVAHVGLARTYAATRAFDAALVEINRAIALAGHDPAFVGELGRIEAAANRQSEARAVLQDLELMSSQGQHVPPDSLASLHVSLGDTDGALTLLEQGVRRRETGLLWLKVDPRFDDLRHTARFFALLRDAGME